MASQAPALPSTTATLLVNWANEQDAWIRALTKTILDSGTPLAEDQVGQLYDQFLQEKHLKDGNPPDVPALTVPANEAGTGTPVQLNAIRDVQHVNALAPGQTITFNPKLTIIFGENAAGKSGYVRVIKRASSARTREPILPNLYTGQAGTPTATIDYTLDGQASSVTWQNEEGLSPLNRIDVFDVRAAAVHVDEDLTYTYTPGELNRFPHIQQGITSVQQRLDRDIGTRTATKNPFVQHFDRRTKLYTSIENLGATTDLSALEQHAIITTEEQERIPTLQTEIEALKSNTPQAQLRLATAHNEHLTTIQHAVTTINTIDPARLRQAQEELAEARSSYDQASKAGFAGLAIPGILQPAWKAFIDVSAGIKWHHFGRFWRCQDRRFRCDDTLPPWRAQRPASPPRGSSGSERGLQVSTLQRLPVEREDRTRAVPQRKGSS